MTIFHLVIKRVIFFLFCNLFIIQVLNYVLQITKSCIGIINVISVFQNCVGVAECDCYYVTVAINCWSFVQIHYMVYLPVNKSLKLAVY